MTDKPESGVLTAIDELEQQERRPWYEAPEAAARRGARMTVDEAPAGLRSQVTPDGSAADSLMSTVAMLELIADVVSTIGVFGRIQWFDRAGAPITDRSECESLLTNPHYRCVGLTSITNADSTATFTVSTLWQGQNYSFSPVGPPLIFETMVFASDDRHPLDLEVRRYAADAQATAGHAEMVQAVAAIVSDSIITEVDPTVVAQAMFG